MESWGHGAAIWGTNGAVGQYVKSWGYGLCLINGYTDGIDPYPGARLIAFILEKEEKVTHPVLGSPDELLMERISRERSFPTGSQLLNGSRRGGARLHPFLQHS